MPGSSLHKQDTVVLDKNKAASVSAALDDEAAGDSDSPQKFVSVQSHKFMSVDLRFMSGGDEEESAAPAQTFTRVDGPPAASRGSNSKTKVASNSKSKKAAAPQQTKRKASELASPSATHTPSPSKRQRKPKALDYDDIVGTRSPASTSPARAAGESPRPRDKARPNSSGPKRPSSPASAAATPKPAKAAATDEKPGTSSDKTEKTPKASNKTPKGEKKTPKAENTPKSTPKGRGRPRKQETPKETPSRVLPKREAATPSEKPETPKQSPKEEKPKKKRLKDETDEDNPLRYRIGEYLAIRNEENGFYLCRNVCQNVYEKTRKWRVYWMDELKDRPGFYRFEYVEWLIGDYSCVICHVKMRKVKDEKKVYELPADERRKIDTILNAAVSGKPLKAEAEDKDADAIMDVDEEAAGEEESAPVASTSRADDTAAAETEDVGEDTEEEFESPATSASDGAAVSQSKRARLEKKLSEKRAKALASKARKTAAKSPQKEAKAKEQEARRAAIAAKKAERAAQKAALEAEKAEKRQRLAMQKRVSNAALVGRGSVNVLAKDPLMDSREEVPFVSTTAHSKLILRAVNLGDHELLQTYINDTQHVANLLPVHSVGLYRDPIQIALLKGHKEILQTLIKSVKSPAPSGGEKGRVGPTKSLLGTADTGTYNRRALGGLPFIRKLAQSRGSREGNNALTKDSSHPLTASIDRSYVRRILKFCLREGVDKEMIDLFLLLVDPQDDMGGRSVLYEHVYLAVERGHRRLAGLIVKEQADSAFSQFNALHRDVLLLEGEDLKVVRAASVRKKPYDNNNITPLHCAAINPDVKYLQKLLSVVPEFGLMDARQRRPAHYAAAAEGPGPLEFLLKRGLDMNDVDRSGYTPMHIACEAGRRHNVEALMRKAQQALESHQQNGQKEAGDGEDECEDEEAEFDPVRAIADKYGVAGINRPLHKPQNRAHHGYCPLHIAAENGHTEVVKALIAAGANLEVELGASKNKKTPLMIAAGTGNLDIVRLLVNSGAKVEARDKLKRTPLMHAVMSGHAHVASFLLSLGASARSADTSNNTATHYAAAYGWVFCLQLLLRHGADPNVPNDWKLTPLGIAFMKGHMGLADILLEQPGVDINFRNDDGLTLVGIACGSPLEPGIVEQVSYLIERRGADAATADIHGNTALHHLASNPIRKGPAWNLHVSSEMAERSLELARLLIAKGCDPATRNDEGETPVMKAVEQANLPLVKLLVSAGSRVDNTLNRAGRNVLHLMAEQCMQQRLKGLVNIIADSVAAEEMKTMISQPDHDGFTPLLTACLQYAKWNGQKAEESSESKKSAEDDDEGSGSEPEEEEPEEEEEAPEEEEEEEDQDENDDENEDEPMEEENAEEEEMDDDDDEDDSKVEEEEPATLEKRKLSAAYQQWQDARDFIQALVVRCGADVNTTVGKRRMTPPLPEKEKDHYVNDTGRQGVLHLLHNVPHELPLLGDEDEAPCDLTPCLSLLLSYQPDLDEADLAGRTPLTRAIAAAYTHGALALIRHGADVAKASADTDTDLLAPPIILAIRHGKADIVRELLTLHRAELDINATDRHGNGVVHHAVLKVTQSRSHLDLLTMVLDAGANINQVNHKKRTPLHLAVNADGGGADASSELPELLISRGADVFALDVRGRLPLHYCFVKIGRHTDTSCVDPIALTSALTLAMNGRGVDDKDDFEQTPLHRAALRGAAVCCKHLTQKGADVNAIDSNGNTPLGMAVFQEHESCTMMLMQCGANLNMNIVLPAPDDDDDDDDEEEEEEEEGRRKRKPAWRWKPLTEGKKMEASVFPIFQNVVYNEWQGVTYLMLDALADHAIPFSATVEAALCTNKFHLALTLLRKAPGTAALTAANKDGQNLLHWAALKAKPGHSADLQKRVIEQLLSRGVSATQTDVRGCLPLHYAALTANSTAIKALLDGAASDEAREAMLRATDGFKRTPLAAYFWNYQTSRLADTVVLGWLVTSPSALNQLTDFPLPSETLFGYSPSRQDKSYQSAGSASRTTPLILAIRHKDFAGVKSLLKLGADCNAPDDHKLTPLMHAVKVNDVEIIRLLLDHDYDPAAAARAATEAAAAARAALVKQHSRQLFTLGRTAALGAAGDNTATAVVNGGDAAATEAAGTAADPDTVPEGDIFIDYPVFPRRSPIELDLQDQQGWSAVHHLVCPLEYGTYDNVQLLAMLRSAGANIQIQDNAGLTALDYSFIRMAPRLVKALQKMSGKDKADWANPSFVGTPLKEPVEFSGPNPDYRSDADSLLREAAETDGDRKPPAFTAAPDENLAVDADTCEVCMDESLELPYDILLTKVDVKAGAWGLYNFYKAQVVVQRARQLYILFTRWGRIGDTGQFQQTPFPSRDAAVREFTKLVRAKTGNKWADIKSFEPRPGKYRLVELEQRTGGRRLRDLDLSMTSEVKSRLPQDVQDLVREITDVRTMSSALSHYNVDTDLVPFGRLKKSALVKARDILAQIKPLIDRVKELRNSQPLDAEAYHSTLQQICVLSSEFYGLVPLAGYSVERVRPLDRAEDLAERWRLVTNLLDMECAGRITAGATYRRNTVNPVEYVYRCLGCRLQLMQEQEVESQYLLRYIHSTAANKFRVEGLFRVARQGEEKRLQACDLNNHMLLFHGSSAHNLLSILKQGLKVAPPEAPAAGYNYGKGIYTADTFTKSAAYCHNFGESGARFMLVCEVALGRPREELAPVYVDRLDDGYNSVIGVGSHGPNPDFDVTLPSGARIPLGNYMKKPELKDKSRWATPRRCYTQEHNEYIVYNEDQVCVRYIVQFSQKR